MKNRMSGLAATLTITAGLIALAPTAEGSVIVTFVSNVACGPNTCWTYSISNSTSPNTHLSEGSFFTLHDFGPVIGTPTMPGGWSFSTALTGPTGAGTSPIDSNAIMNASFMDTGNGVLGQFTLVSAVSTAVSRSYSGQNLKDSNNNVDGGTGFVNQPGAPDGRVPEPTTLALIGFGLASLGLIKRKRHAY